LTKRSLQRQFGAETATTRYKDVWALQGGFDAWQDAGLPVESKQKAA
jgi:rhodanese-related sulfurtransferase